MHIIVVMLLIVSILGMSFLYPKSMGSAQRVVGKPATPKVVSPPLQPSIPVAESKDDIVKKLDKLLQQQVVDDVWRTSVNDLIFKLVLIDKNLSNTYFEKILAKTAQDAEAKASSVLSKTVQKKELTPQLPAGDATLVPLQPSLSVAKSKDDIIKKLDDMLQRKIIDDAWYTTVDNLVFDLALLDRNVSNEYLKKIRMKTVPVVPAKVSLPAEAMQKEALAPIIGGAPSVTGEAMQKGTPPPPPTGIGLKKGTPPPPPTGPMKKAGTPPPPPGPMTKGGKKTAPMTKAPVAAAVPKGPEPLSIKETYGTKQLEKRTNEEVLELFNKLLDALGTYGYFWNAVTNPPKPQLDWENKIGTVKKALVAKTIMSEDDANKKIQDRITAVRAEKVSQGKEKQVSAEAAAEKEKKTEEISEQELIKVIDALNKKPDVNDFKWLIQFTGKVKQLDAINHDKAVAYENAFINKFPGQKSFLPKKKEMVSEKKLTEQEQKIAIIDKILVDKPAMWPIKVREHVQELYDMNPELGLTYQQKVLDATKKETNKEDKPFLKLK